MSHFVGLYNNKQDERFSFVLLCFIIMSSSLVSMSASADTRIPNYEFRIPHSELNLEHGACEARECESAKLHGFAG